MTTGTGKKQGYPQLFYLLMTLSDPEDFGFSTWISVSNFKSCCINMGLSSDTSSWAT